MACKAPGVWRKNTGKAMFSAIKPLIRHQVLSFVIPAKAGIQPFGSQLEKLDPGFRRDDDNCSGHP
jgi:hypothetical protein